MNPLAYKFLLASAASTVGAGLATLALLFMSFNPSNAGVPIGLGFIQFILVLLGSALGLAGLILSRKKIGAPRATS